MPISWLRRSSHRRQEKVELVEKSNDAKYAEKGDTDILQKSNLISMSKNLSDIDAKNTFLKSYVLSKI